MPNQGPDIEWLSEPAKDIEFETMESLFNHVLLPRVLPQEKQRYPIELKLMTMMVKNVKSQGKYLPPETVTLFKNLEKVHLECTPEVISESINKLRSGETFAIFVRRQNTLFMIYAPLEEDDGDGDLEDVIVATFPGNLHPKEMYANDSDIAFNYPAQAVKVKFSPLLKSVDFASQLSYLNEELPKDAKNRNYVSKWLLTLLADENSSTASLDELPSITKKMRDEVLGFNKNYFRRSSFYMSIKVLLQHNLTMKLGADLGKYVYKILMLKFLTGICNLSMNPKYVTFDTDLLSQMISKLARRIEKLPSITPEIVPDDIVELYFMTINETTDAIEIVRDKINNQHDLMQRTDEENARLPMLSGLNFQSDICHKMPKLREYLRKRNQRMRPKRRNTKYNVKSYRRHFNNPQNPIQSMNYEIEDHTERNIYWIEFEYDILYCLEINKNGFVPIELRGWMFAYVTYAQQAYENDPICTSRMMLVCLKMIATLDQYVTKKYPLLKEHHSGIDSRMFTLLLLPQSADMKIAHQLEEYFRRRNEKASDPSLTGENQVSEKSFSVKFAKQDQSMIQSLDRILAQDERNVLEKEESRDADQRKVERLRREAGHLECLYRINRIGERYHAIQKCRRCCLMKEANGVRLSEYEHLLPKEKFKQFAVVFERYIPSDIAHLRDMLFGFAKFCNGYTVSICIKGSWTESQNNPRIQSSMQYVALGSTTKRQLTTWHVDERMEIFIVNNSFNCTFYGRNGFETVNQSGFFNAEEIPTAISMEAINKLCTFKMQDEYECLQWTVNSTLYIQNQVLSRQCECPQNLSLSEYTNFGSLRADGHRLQLRHLYAMIETEALSFEKSSVLSLILQTLWENGIVGDSGFIREYLKSINDPEFCSAMIEIMQKYVEQQKSSWAHPFKLMMATLIGIRAYEINETKSVSSKIVQLLNNIRAIALDWIDKVEEISCETQRIEDANELRMKLIYIAIIGGLTFSVHPMHKDFEQIFTDHTPVKAVESWLQFLIIMRKNILLHKSDANQLKSNEFFRTMFVRLIDKTAVDLESKVKSEIMAGRVKVIELIQKHWPSACNVQFRSYNFDGNYPHILEISALTSLDLIENTTTTVTIDILTGEFLVNGSSVCRLPSNIIQNEDYQRLYGNAAFEVQPDARGNFSTIQRGTKNIFIDFENYDNDCIITERRQDGFKREHIPYRMFRGDFPFLLVGNYSHWLNEQEKCVEFRVRTYGQKWDSNETEIHYRLCLATRQLIQIKTQRPTLDINSPSYKKIVGQLERLEHRNHIHVLLDNDQIAVAELLRMKLKFHVNCSKPSNQGFALVSNEFSGMRISREQKVGTLYGFNHGLVLESVSDTKTKMLLIPNGNIEIVPIAQHISVSIDLSKELRNPPFYQYHVDEFCKQIKSNNSNHASWFYLAYLHAITSFGEIEPFTQMSGTERALQILQSAFAWSSSPYASEAVEMLHAIANLSPIRKFGTFGSGYKQIVTWPSNIPAHSAHDSFVFIAKKLLDDSYRLHGLYSEDSVENLDFDTNWKLNERDYHRCLQLKPNSKVLDTFIVNKELKTASTELSEPSFSPDTRTVSILYHKQNYMVSNEFDLERFLAHRRTLNGMANDDCIQNILSHNAYESFADLWIRLYDIARTHKFERNEQFALVLSLLAHHKEDIGAILALQAISLNSSEFKLINPPPISEFNISDGTYNPMKVRSLLREFIPFHLQFQINLFNRCIVNSFDKFITDLEAAISRSWPCDSYDLSEWKFVSEDEEFNFNSTQANAAINHHLKIWHNNYELAKFIKKVVEKLHSLPVRIRLSTPLPQCLPYNNIAPSNWAKFDIDFEKKLCDGLNEFEDEIKQAQSVWKSREQSGSASKWWEIIETILNSDEVRYLIYAGIFPRTVPSVLLPKIIANNTDDRLKALIGAWAIAIVHEQRQKRIEMYAQRPELKAAMDREIQNEPHLNWKPCEYPHWLLFEIEQNLSIRRIQIEIAKRMIDPPEINVKHSVMQLNMGEGKTAVIVPIVAAVLANGHQACQITVLKPLFTRNRRSLQQYLGGLLNQRIYTFPCRRDMPINKYIGQILDIYEECKENRGVILTLPEYRLSFQLKIYESIEKGNFEAASRFLDVHKWMNQNIRNILDESDAILHANYQLTYTVDNKLSLDGGDDRWFAIQALFKRIPIHMKALFREFGKEKIEFDDRPGAHRPDEFTPCRILDEDIFEVLKPLLINDIINGKLPDIPLPEVVASSKRHLKCVLTDKIVNKKSFQYVESLPANEQTSIMVLSGLLRFEVLKLALTKRWRVNYGVDPKRHQKMAIPFKAKDVAADMTEFGHSDVAICFTQISYYYSGLTDKQLDQVFNILENKPHGPAIYDKWIHSIQSELIDASIRSYKGINLEDPYLRDSVLYPLLRSNMHVIDFWLANIVYPHEAKIYEKKLTCTTWDLCGDNLQHCVTGFSGTNDTNNILPLPIAQNDLQELEKTNKEVRKKLLQPENQSYEKLPPNVSGMDILTKLTNQKVPVLLDSGALMLELNNEQVATEWLKMTLDTSFEAAVYFDSRDILQTVDRNGIITEFDSSVYRENLGRCLVYLDDVHTRGTDLKFPPNWKACVTLSGDITRDKTVQSCMRMRQLGTCHSICFKASYEADVRMREICSLSAGDRIKNEHVMKFIENNSKQFEKKNMVHWAAGSLNYTKKTIGHKLFEDRTDENSLIQLYDICVDSEFVKLNEMYGDKTEAPLSNIAMKKFQKLEYSYRAFKEIRNFMSNDFVQIKFCTVDKLDDQAADVKQFSNALEEEQERELEVEQEQEEYRHVERPPAIKAASPVFDKRLIELILNGPAPNLVDCMKDESILTSISDSLLNTQLSEFCKNNKEAWAKHIYVTKDFRTVIESRSLRCDEFLRPIWWVALVSNRNSTPILLLLSSFECNNLLPHFRASTNSVLFMYRPRLSKLHSILLHEPKLQVTRMPLKSTINIEDEVQIGVYSGIMYFNNEDEQNAYCAFLGLIPRPRNDQLDAAAKKGVIRRKGFVLPENRHYSVEIANHVGKCEFQDDPCDVAISLIKAHHQTLHKESHVASILEHGTMKTIVNHHTERSDQSQASDN